MHDYITPMTDLAMKIRRIRKTLGKNQAEFAEMFGVTQGSVSRWENGSAPEGPIIARLAELAGVDVSTLLSDGAVGNVIPISLGPQLYVKGSVAAGVFVEATEAPREEWEAFTGRADLQVPASLRYGLRVVGDSMNLAYPPGTIIECQSIIFDELVEPIPNGKRVVVERKRFGDGVETTVKEYLCDDDGVEWLVPRSTNPAHQAFRCDQPGPDIEAIRIIAVVVGSYQPE